MTSQATRIAVIGGTGQEGAGLALRWAAAGLPVTIGSRSAEKAAETAAKLSEKLGRPGAIAGVDNLEAASTADLVVLTVPYAAQTTTADSIRPALAGKILIDVTVPLVPPKVSRVQLPEGGSAAVALQTLLGPEVRVVSAFQNVGAVALADLNRPVDCDVLVCGDDEAARETVIGLANSMGLRALHAGPLANATAAEALTSVLIWINRKYKAKEAGLRITGVGEV